MKNNNYNNYNEIEKVAKKNFDEIRTNAIKAGATGVLGAVLDMCNNGKTINDIKRFCEISLNSCNKNKEI